VPHEAEVTALGIWGARVLVVDNDQDTSEAAERALRDRGADVITVPSVGQALATVIGVVPDLLIVDVTIPGQDGLGLVRAVRSLSPEKGGQVPAITLSGFPLEGGLLLAWLEAGLQGHFLKPFDPAELVAMAERLAGLPVERRRRALDRREWPRDVSRDRRAEVRGDVLSVSSPEAGF
jgi:CheY-like chemotaxis protein